MEINKADVLIVGTGVSGLMTAELLRNHVNVQIITKSKLEVSNSMLAQGGIAAAIGADDHWSKHFLDTLTAGAGHNDEKTTKLLVQKGPEAVEQLLAYGVPFDRDTQGNLLFGQEGAHQRRRILHAGGDATGRAITSTLQQRVRQYVPIYEQELAVDIVVDKGKAIGVRTLGAQGKVTLWLAGAIVLATGGAGQLYQRTSNAQAITGDGMALAYQAGASLSDLEFVQFHPTMLTIQGRALGLVSEAVRGEGGRLVNEQGELIMDGVHPQADLAPRDVVARTLFYRLQQGEQIFLDITKVKNFAQRFPTIDRLCQSNGIDLQSERIPVAPGAHFMVGGVQTNQWAETTLPGLYAVGETACTGVHGANRLASNSLLEGIVFAQQAAERLKTTTVKDVYPNSSLPPLLLPQVLPSVEELQHMMERTAGIVRHGAELAAGEEWLDSFLNGEKRKSFSREEWTLFHMLTTARLIISAALQRTESRGGHFRSDYPERDDRSWLQRHIYHRKNSEVKADESIVS